jgi:hypothetical protein
VRPLIGARGFVIHVVDIDYLGRHLVLL